MKLNNISLNSNISLPLKNTFLGSAWADMVNNDDAGARNHRYSIQTRRARRAQDDRQDMLRHEVRFRVPEPAAGHQGEKRGPEEGRRRREAAQGRMREGRRQGPYKCRGECRQDQEKMT